VTRRSLQNWRKRKDAPKAAANGFHEVAAWREFMQRHGLEGDPAGTDAESAPRARKLLAEVEERELRLAVRKREYVALEEVRGCWTKHVANRLVRIMDGKDKALYHAMLRRQTMPERVNGIVEGEPWGGSGFVYAARLQCCFVS
jgi:hypothetical protein